MEGPFRLFDLPPELVTYILCFLTNYEVARIVHTCHAFYEVGMRAAWIRIPAISEDRGPDGQLLTRTTMPEAIALVRKYGHYVEGAMMTDGCKLIRYGFRHCPNMRNFCLSLCKPPVGTFVDTSRIRNISSDSHNTSGASNDNGGNGGNGENYEEKKDDEVRMTVDPITGDLVGHLDLLPLDIAFPRLAKLDLFLSQRISNSADFYPVCRVPSCLEILHIEIDQGIRVADATMADIIDHFTVQNLRAFSLTSSHVMGAKCGEVIARRWSRTLKRLAITALSCWDGLDSDTESGSSDTSRNNGSDEDEAVAVNENPTSNADPFMHALLQSTSNYPILESIALEHSSGFGHSIGRIMTLHRHRFPALSQISVHWRHCTNFPQHNLDHGAASERFLINGGLTTLRFITSQISICSAHDNSEAAAIDRKKRLYALAKGTAVGTEANGEVLRVDLIIARQQQLTSVRLDGMLTLLSTSSNFGSASAVLLGRRLKTVILRECYLSAPLVALIVGFPVLYSLELDSCTFNAAEATRLISSTVCVAQRLLVASDEMETADFVAFLTIRCCSQLESLILAGGGLRHIRNMIAQARPTIVIEHEISDDDNNSD